jgi:phage protein D
MADTQAYRPARPTLAVGGQDDPVLADRLLSLLIVEHVEGLYRCEAVFSNWGPRNNSVAFLYLDRKVFDFGKAFRVKLGQDTLFEGRIMGLEAQFPNGSSPQLTVLAEDRFQDLRMRRRTRTFADMTDAAVMQQIAGEHGLTANVNVPGPTQKLLAQVNQSDLAFLRERARALGAEVWMEGKTLRAELRTHRQGNTFSMSYGKELREFAVLADLAGQRSSVAVTGWDVKGKAGIRYDATDSVLSGELNGDSSGASILTSALGARKESLVHTVPITSQEAQAEAESYFRMTARRFVTGRGIAETDSRLRVGNQVDLQGLGSLFNGKYYLAQVRHMLDGTHGLRTEFAAERAGLGKA